MRQGEGSHVTGSGEVWLKALAGWEALPRGVQAHCHRHRNINRQLLLLHITPAPSTTANPTLDAKQALSVESQPPVAPLPLPASPLSRPVPLSMEVAVMRMSTLQQERVGKQK